MSKHEKEPQIPWFRLEFDTGDEYICTPKNTSAFLHKNDPDFDHLWVTVEQQTEEMMGIYCFRDQLENFDDIILLMKHHNFTMVPKTEVSEQDREAYQEHVLNKRQREADKPVEYISPRSQTEIERITDYILYLIDHDLFNFEGPVDL